MCAGIDGIPWIDGLATKLFNKQSSCRWFEMPWSSCDCIIMGWTLRITYLNRFHATASCNTFDKRYAFSLPIANDTTVYNGIVTYTTLTRNRWFDTEYDVNYIQFTQQLTMSTLFHINIIFLNTYWTGLGSIPFFQFNSNSFTFNSNSNSFGMKNSNSNSNSNSFLSIPIPIPFYQFIFKAELNPTDNLSWL